MRLSDRRAALNNRVVVWVMVAIVGLTTGCSSNKRQNVSGVVTLDGRPLTEGIVQFYGPGDRLSTARIQSDGTFVATDLMPGDSIQVVVLDDLERSMSRVTPPKGKAAAPPVDRNPVAPGKAVRIPAKYKDFKTSGLNYTITPSTQRIEIQLQS